MAAVFAPHLNAAASQIPWERSDSLLEDSRELGQNLHATSGRPESVPESDQFLLRQPLRMTQEPLHVAYIADRYTDPTAIGSWSGAPYFALRALERHGVRFTVFHLDERAAWVERWMKFLWHKLIRRKRYLRDRNPHLLKSFGRQLAPWLREVRPDLVFLMATAPIAYLQAECPIAFWVDATFAGMSDFYGSFTELAQVSLRDGEATDREALRRSSLAIYSSDWAAETARLHYPVDPRRVHFVNLGANIERTLHEDEIALAISQRDHATCRLLFVGVDWKRKGADLAIAIAAALRAMGVPVRLTIIGCLPPSGVSIPDFVELVGFLSKRTEEGNRRIEQYFRESHFFVLPTRAEAYGLVFCEASAFGLPSIAPNIGGISSIIEDGANGWLVPPDATAEWYARLLSEGWRDRAGYEVMARRCHRIYRERLNWDGAAGRVAALMRDCVRDARAASQEASP
jgi:glycosyltransferase involved in cell wall biosynthesis